MQHNRQGMSIKHLIFMLVICSLPIVVLGVAWLLDIPLGTVDIIALLLLCPLGHFFMMRWMGHGHGHPGMTSGQPPVERSVGPGMMSSDEIYEFEVLTVDNGRGQRDMGWFSRLLGEDRTGHATEMHGMQSHEQTSGVRGRKATDPVCGMEVDIDMATCVSVHQGQNYYLCSPSCKKAFDQDPARYSRGGGGHGMSGHGCCHGM